MKFLAALVLSAFAGYAVYWPEGHRVAGALTGLLVFGLVRLLSKNAPITRGEDDPDGL